MRWCGWLGAFVFATSACSVDDSAEVLDAESGDTTIGDPTAGDTAPMETAPADVSSEGGEGEEDGSSSGNGAMQPGAPDSTGDDSDGLTCDLVCGNGSCLDEDGVEVCVCDEGHAFNGATCVACVDVPNTLDLATADVRLRITFNGEPAPASAGEFGTITLRNRQTGDSVELGETRMPELSGSVLAADYDVYYNHVVGTVVPANRGLRIATIQAKNPVDQAIDIATVPVYGAFYFDGNEAPDSASESGRVLLRDRHSGGELTVGVTNGLTYSIVVAPGSYDAVYEAIGSGAVAPANTKSVFKSFSIDDDGGSLDFDIATVAIGGTFYFDDLEAPASPAESGHISLQAGDDIVDLGDTNGGTFSVRAIPAFYEVVYEARSGSAVAPGNSRAVFSTLMVSADQPDDAIAINVETVPLDGSFTFNGQPAPDDPTDDGLIVLRHASGDEVALGYTSGGTYSRRVVRGEYEVHYVQDSSRDAAPRNTNARLMSLSAQRPASIDIEVPSVSLSGEFTVGGATPPISDYEDGLIYLRDAETGDSVLLGNTRNGTYVAPVVPGQYDIVYVADTPGGPLPSNTGAVIGTVDLEQNEPVGVVIDVPSVVIAGGITVDTAAPPVSTQDAADLYLIDAVTREQLYLATTIDGAYAQTLTPGSYLVNYRVLSSTGLVPINANASLGCWQVK